MNGTKYYARIYDYRTYKWLTIGAHSTSQLLEDLKAIDKGAANVAGLKDLSGCSILFSSVPHDKRGIDWLDDAIVKYFGY